MGMDTVELIMDIEDRFGVSISNDDAAAVRTVGELSDMVERLLSEKSATGGPAVCLTSMAFFRFRRAVAEVCHVERKRVSPGEVIDVLVARKARRREWAEMARRTSMKMPPLHRPDWCVWVGLGFVATFVAGCWQTRLGIESTALLCWATLAILIFGIGAFGWVTRPLAIHLSPRTITCGELARELVALNFASLRARGETIRREELWQAIVHTVAESAGADAAKIERSTRIVEDLAMD
ncbi:MAG: acyl carrier protein [Pirellulales bacterium]